MGEKMKYWVGFNKMPGIGPVRLKLLMETLGGIEPAWNATADDLVRIGLSPKVIEDFLQVRSKLDLDAEMGRPTVWDRVVQYRFRKLRGPGGDQERQQENGDTTLHQLIHVITTHGSGRIPAGIRITGSRGYREQLTNRRN